MRRELFRKKTLLDAPVEEVFKWHEREGALLRLSPPWDPIRLIASTGGIAAGSINKLNISWGPFSIEWLARHTDYSKNKFFRDTQVKGPFRYWVHSHFFKKRGPGKTLLEDVIEYQFPMHGLSRFVFSKVIRRRLDRIFTYRHDVLRLDLQRHAPFLQRKPLQIVIAGGSGLIGSKLIPFLTTGGHKVMQLVRDKSKADDQKCHFWNPASGLLDPRCLEGCDAVINLCGENIGTGRWSKAKKKRIIESRVKATSLLARTITHLEHPPGTFLSASAIGYYGNRKAELLTEDSRPGNDFISQVCQLWEKAAREVEKAGIRVVLLGIGVVVTPEGGALKKLLPLSKMGLGAQFGIGDQYMSWVSMEDVLGAFYYLLFHEDIRGAVNIAAPHPVTNREFTEILAKVLAKTAHFQVPESVVLALFGEMGREILLASTRVFPRKLTESGYKFAYANLDTALLHTLGLIREN